MRGSNTITYIIAAIILLHFIVGFVYLIIKMSPRKEDKTKDKTTLKEEE